MFLSYQTYFDTDGPASKEACTISQSLICFVNYQNIIHFVICRPIIYANLLIIFDALAQWTVLGLSLSQDEQIWCPNRVLLELSTCTSGFWFRSLDSFLHSVHVLCHT